MHPLRDLILLGITNKGYRTVTQNKSFESAQKAVTIVICTKSISIPAVIRILLVLRELTVVKVQEYHCFNILLKEKKMQAPSTVE